MSSCDGHMMVYVLAGHMSWSHDIACAGHIMMNVA